MASSNANDREATTPPRIDAHQHYWKISRGDYGWMGAPEVAAIRRDYLPADLAPERRAQGVDFTIAVQAAPTRAETDFLLSLAASEPSLVGVVGWLDVEASDFEAQLDAYAPRPEWLGIRPMLQDLADDAYILRQAVQHNLRLLARAGKKLDLLVLTRHLPHAVRALEANPELSAIVDHCAKPDLKNRDLATWKSGIRALAQNPRVHCKLSGLVTEANPGCSASDLAPAVEHVLSCFGPERLAFGSDWPVCALAASYARVVELFREVLGGQLTPEFERALFGDNARAFYGLKLPEA